MNETNSIPAVHSSRHPQDFLPKPAGRASRPPLTRATFFAHGWLAGPTYRQPACRLVAASGCGVRGGTNCVVAHVGKHGASNVSNTGKAFPNAGKHDRDR